MVYRQIITRRYRNRDEKARWRTLRIRFRASIIANPTRIERIAEELERAANQAQWHFFIDLIGVRFMSARLLQRLVPLCQEYQQQQFISLPICDASTQLCEMMRWSGLGEITTVVPQAKDALQILAATNQPKLLRVVG